MERFVHEFKQEGYILRRPSLPAVRADAFSEITLGGTLYRYYGKGQYFFEEAHRFALRQSANGFQGRLLTLPCQAVEVWHG
jgi:hypothetical protein